MMEDRIKELMKPFPKEAIKQREGPYDKAAGRNKVFDYIGGNDILQRLLEVVDTFNWQILSFKLMPAEIVTKQGRDGEYTVNKSAYWLVHGRLSIEGLGDREGIGTQVVENEDSIKGAETDALKRALVKFGCGLSLYEDTHPADTSQAGHWRPQQPQGSAKPKTYMETASKRGQERQEKLFLEWEKYWNATHLSEVTGVEIPEEASGEERDIIWRMIEKMTSAQLDKMQKELSGEGSKK